MALINCKECGKEISDAATVCPHCGAPVVKDVYCRKCGTKVPENVKFCPNCGETVSGPSGVEKPAKEKIVAGIFAINFFAIGLHYFYLGKTTAGILTIVLNLVSCGIWAILMVVQGILILMMDDDTFQAKYVNNEKTFPLF